MLDKGVSHTDSLNLQPIDAGITQCLQDGAAESTLQSIFFHGYQARDLCRQRLYQLNIQWFDKAAVHHGSRNSLFF